MKLAGKPGTGEPYAGFDEAGAGNGPILGTAPVLDHTREGLGVKFPRATPRLNAEYFLKNSFSNSEHLYDISINNNQKAEEL